MCMGCGEKAKDLIMEDQKGCIRRCEEFEYLVVKKQNKNDIKNRINKGRAITAILNCVLWNRKITRKKKLQIYNSISKRNVTYGAE